MHGRGPEELAASRMLWEQSFAEMRGMMAHAGQSLERMERLWQMAAVSPSCLDLPSAPSSASTAPPPSAPLRHALAPGHGRSAAASPPSLGFPAPTILEDDARGAQSPVRSPASVVAAAAAAQAAMASAAQVGPPGLGPPDGGGRLGQSKFGSAPPVSIHSLVAGAAAGQRRPAMHHPAPHAQEASRLGSSHFRSGPPAVCGAEASAAAAVAAAVAASKAAPIYQEMPSEGRPLAKGPRLDWSQYMSHPIPQPSPQMVLLAQHQPQLPPGIQDGGGPDRALRQADAQMSQTAETWMEQKLAQGERPQAFSQRVLEPGRFASAPPPDSGGGTLAADTRSAPGQGEVVDDQLNWPSMGSTRHPQGTCKPCLFWYQGLCHKGRRCLFCHIPHEMDEVKRVRPSKKTRNLLQQQRQKDDPPARSPSPPVVARDDARHES